MRHFISRQRSNSYSWSAFELDVNHTFAKLVMYRTRQHVVAASATTCFETRLGCIDADNNSWHQRMIDSNVDIFQLSLKLQFSLQFYKLFRTTTWSKLIEREDFFLGYEILTNCCIRFMLRHDSLGLYLFIVL